MKRWSLFLGGLAASIALTALLWSIGLPGFFLFLFFPLLLFPWRRDEPPRLRCQACGRASPDPAARFCPYDGKPLRDDLG